METITSSVLNPLKTNCKILIVPHLSFIRPNINNPIVSELFSLSSECIICEDFPPSLVSWTSNDGVTSVLNLYWNYLIFSFLFYNYFIFFKWSWPNYLFSNTRITIGKFSDLVTLAIVRVDFSFKFPLILSSPIQMFKEAILLQFGF